MSSVLLQAESSSQKHLPDQLSAIKNFLAWKKDPSRPRGRQVDLLEPSTQLLSHYNKLEIKQYEMFLWAERNKNRAFLRKHSSDADETVMELMKKMQQTNVLLNKNNFLFNHNTSKEEDSFILDYIHGNSLIFGHNRHKHLGEENVCSFCNETQDGRVHQLSECKEVQDETYQAYTRSIEDHQNYIIEILSSDEKEKQTAFIDRVKFLKGQHEFLLELEDQNKESDPS